MLQIAEDNAARLDRLTQSVKLITDTFEPEVLVMEEEESMVGCHH